MFIDVLEVQKAYHKYRKNISQIQCANDSEIRLNVINNPLLATQFLNSAKCVIRKKRRITFYYVPDKRGFMYVPLGLFTFASKSGTSVDHR